MPAVAVFGLVLAGAAAVVLVWGWFEAGWVRFRQLEVELAGLPPALNGVRVVHLSDFHLGTPSRGERAVARAVDWTAARAPDVVCITGDLLSRARGEARLRELLSRLRPCCAILGNHDIALSRNPFSRGTRMTELGPATLLSDTAVTLELRGRPVLVAGADPASRGREPDLSGKADLQILLVHFPDSFDGISDGRYDLVLSGHIHDGQICLPFPGGKIRLAHLSTRYPAGLYRRGTTAMYVSPGLGTTFVPFRFFARPEATELTLRSPS